MPKKINNKFELGDRVYLDHDPEQHERMVTMISISFGNIISYSLACGTEVTDHFEEEINADRSVI